MSNQHSTRPKDTHGSWVVRWTGKDNETPIMESSNWAPGYTPAHCATQGEALAHAMARVTREIAIVRQKWVSLTMILEQDKETYVNEMHATVGVMIAGTPGLAETVQVNDAGERWSQEEIDLLEKSEAEAEEAERQRKGHPDYDPEEEWLPRD